MRFYYFSLFSWILWAVYGAIAVTALSLLWAKLLKLRFRNPVYWGLVATVLIAPWGEELWIAYKFDQFCRKDAGVFVEKLAQVDGFYDDTTHWWRQLTESSNYKFVESRDNATGQLWRVERIENEVHHFRIDKPTARYHFKSAWSDRALRVTHKIRREESSVLDTKTGSLIAQYVLYSRQPYWFYVGLEAPYGCDGPEGGPNPRHSSLIYRRVLIPAK